MGPLSAAARWRRDLEAWALPDDLLARADEDPWGWPEAVLAGMRPEGEAGAANPTLDVLGRLLPAPGSVLDVGAGAGRLAIPLARFGHRVTAVEPNPLMTSEVAAGAAGLPVIVIEASWPAAAESLPRHDVALSAHVVYDVADLGPFLVSLHQAAGAVVIECGARHPWADLAPLYRALHGLERPSRPTSEDLAIVVAEATGSVPEVIHWEEERPLRFADKGDLLAWYRRRLVLGSDRTAELEALLVGDLRMDGGSWTVGSGRRAMTTLWWRD